MGKIIYKLIKVDGYWIVVSDEDMYRGCNVLHNKVKVIPCMDNPSAELWNENKDQFQLVVFSQNPAHNLLTIAFSDKAAKELGIVDVEKLANKNADTYDWDFESSCGNGYNDHVEGYKNGYNQCLSDNVDKRFTLEDMRNAFNAARETSGMNQRNAFGKKYRTADDYIQSIIKEEYFCELEMEIKCCGLLKDMIKNSDLTEGCKYCSCIGNTQPKITNNSVKILRVWK